MNLNIMARRIPLRFSEETGGYHVTIPDFSEDVDVQVLDGFIDPEYKTGHVDLLFMGLSEAPEVAPAD